MPDAPNFGKVPGHGRRAVTSLANTPWMTEAVDALARELRMHHAPTADHSHRLATLARNVAERLALDALEATEVELVAVLHDVGKLTIDPDLLDWHGPLDDEQRARIRRHTIAGEELLAEIAGLEHLANLVRATHEAWDGSGYPDGLRGERIPLTARIVSAADSFDAMTSERAYRSALPRREACRRLRNGSGAQFDPRVLDALLRVVGCGPLRRS
jgi:two-component system, cell cycle response regulator